MNFPTTPPLMQYIKRPNIDPKKWDALVLSHPQGACATTWYLDIVTNKKWDALVLGDYAAVMPLPYKTLFLGIRRLYQPPFTQQLGIFSGETSVAAEIVSLFLDAIPKKYIHQQINFQANTVLPTQQSIQKLNLYTTSNTPYSKSLQKKLRQAAAFDFYVEEILPTQLHTIYMQETAPKIGFFSKKLGNVMLHLMKKAVTLQQGRVVGVHEKASKKLLFACFLLSNQSPNQSRTLNPFGAYTQEGRDKHATIFLYDYLIRENLKKGIALDFMGSSIPVVATFFKNFGCIEEYYGRIERFLGQKSNL
jgi:hypothetical protein